MNQKNSNKHFQRLCFITIYYFLHSNQRLFLNCFVCVCVGVQLCRSKWQTTELSSVAFDVHKGIRQQWRTNMFSNFFPDASFSKYDKDPQAGSTWSDCNWAKPNGVESFSDVCQRSSSTNIPQRTGIESSTLWNSWLFKQIQTSSSTQRVTVLTR